MTRTFHPIGQGAFYTEVFESGFVAIYDCGGSNKKIIEDEIKATFDEKQKIDVVFISHLHNDHINGLEFLLHHCDVKKVVLPLLNDAMRLWFVIENAIYNRNKNNAFIDDLIINTEKILDDKVVFVEPIDDNNLAYESVEILNLSQQIKSNTKIVNQQINWLYIPLNFQYDLYADNLKIALAKIDVTISNIVLKLQTNRQDIIDVYKYILGGTKNFNANSMTVYSGKICDRKISMLTKQSNKFFINNEVGCLYIGDFEAKEQSKFDNLKNAYKTYWAEISTVQIPHHGSSHNFHNDLAWSDSISIISTGFRYNHPSSRVVKEIVKQNSWLGLVTKNNNTKVTQYIKSCKIKSLACISSEVDDLLQDKYPECFI